MNTYANLPVFFARGEGVWLWDEDGRKYLDGLAGIAVTRWATTIRAWSRRSPARRRSSSTPRTSPVRLQETLADKLCRTRRAWTRSFFCNSGLEANEAAIKIARQARPRRAASTNPEIVVLRQRVPRPLDRDALGDRHAKVHKGFEPLVEGFVRVPMNDMDAIERVAAEHRTSSRCSSRPSRAKAASRRRRIEYLKAARALRRQGWLLMIDEVQCGVGRTGKWFAHQWAGILPDVMPLAKGLAGGVPIGAVVARGEAADVFGPGNHGTTFGGNPLACRAALETIAVIEDDGLLANAEQMGQAMRSVFSRELSSVAGVLDIRGRGLMLGIELACPCGDIPKRALGYTRDYGLLINVTHDRVVRLLPSLVIDVAGGRAAPRASSRSCASSCCTRRNPRRA